jgi:hypothetical protein
VIRALARWLTFLRVVRGEVRPRVLKNDWARVQRLQTLAARRVHQSQLPPGHSAGRIFGDTQ